MIHTGRGPVSVKCHDCVTNNKTKQHTHTGTKRRLPELRPVPDLSVPGNTVYNYCIYMYVYVYI